MAARAVERYQIAERHGLTEIASASLLAGDSDSQFRERILSHLVARAAGATFSFARLVQQLLSGRASGIERDTLERVVPGSTQAPHVATVPWGLFARDLGVASSAAGGYLRGTDVGDALDVLRPWSVTASAGLTVLEGLVGDVAIPRTATKTTGYWILTETSTITESTPGLGQIALTPKNCGALVEFSRQLALQSAAEAYIRRELLRTLGTLVDQAVLNGSGAAGQPLGLLGTAGVQTVSGTTLGQAGVTSMKSKCATANAPDELISFLATPAVRELLENRERATGGGTFVWDDDRVASRPGRVTTDMPTATMVAGAWSDILLALWGSGFEISLNPFEQANFPKGIIQARILCSLDVAVGHPSAFCSASSIT